MYWAQISLTSVAILMILEKEQKSKENQDSACFRKVVGTKNCGQSGVSFGRADALESEISK